LYEARTAIGFDDATNCFQQSQVTPPHLGIALFACRTLMTFDNPEAALPAVYPPGEDHDRMLKLLRHKDQLGFVHFEHLDARMGFIVVEQHMNSAPEELQSLYMEHVELTSSFGAATHAIACQVRRAEVCGARVYKGHLRQRGYAARETIESIIGKTHCVPGLHSVNIGEEFRMGVRSCGRRSAISPASLLSCPP
jgi:hypothetical protein